MKKQSQPLLITRQSDGNQRWYDDTKTDFDFDKSNMTNHQNDFGSVIDDMNEMYLNMKNYKPVEMLGQKRSLPIGNLQLFNMQQYQTDQKQDTMLISTKPINYVTKDVFEQTISKLWQLFQRIKNDQKQDVYQITEKLQDLEKRVDQFSKNPRYIERTRSSLKKGYSDNDLQMNIQESLKVTMKKEIHQVYEQMDQLRQKFFSTTKDLQSKFNVLQDKVLESQSETEKFQDQVQTLNHRFSILKEECEQNLVKASDLSKDIQYNDKQRQNFKEIEEQVNQMDKDMLNMFSQIKSFLQIENRLNQNSIDIDALKLNQNQLWQTISYYLNDS